MNSSDFSIEKLRQLFESALPENVTIQDYRKDIDRILLDVLPGDYVEESPQRIYNRLCMDATIKSVLKIAYPHKYEVDFYDLICISTLFLNKQDEELHDFLCKEILQTTSENRWQSFCVNELQKKITIQKLKKETLDNNGVHPSLTSKIIGYDKLKKFLNESKEKYAEIVVDNVYFTDDKISITLTSWAEYVYGEDFEFATDYPVGTVKIEIDEVAKIITDTHSMKEVHNGNLKILPCGTNEGSVEFSYIHQYTDTPIFKFICKKINIIDYEPSGVNLDLY